MGNTCVRRGYKHTGKYTYHRGRTRAELGNKTNHMAQSKDRMGRYGNPPQITRGKTDRAG